MCQCIRGLNDELNSKRTTRFLLCNLLSLSYSYNHGLQTNLYLKMLKSLFIFRGIIPIGLVISGYIVGEQFGVLLSFIEIYFDRHDKEAKAHNQHYHHHCSPFHVSCTMMQTTKRTFMMCVRVVMLQTTQTR